MIEKTRKAGIRNDRDVALLLDWLREPIVSTQCLCGEPDHTPPFRFLADVLLRRVHDYTVWACRSGSKSYLAGLSAWINSSFLPGLETTVLGGSLDQSKKVYKAMNSFWAMTRLDGVYLVGEPTQHSTIWTNGSEVTILTASPKSVRGPHPQHLILDEIDEMPLDVYQAALSQPTSKRGLRASTGKLSTNHRFGGVMDDAVDSAKRAGLPFYKWCIWDVMSPCLDLSCSTCELSRFCPGEQMKRADGYYSPIDFISKLRNLSAAALMTEWFCKKVGRSDLVYGQQFNEDIIAPRDLPGFSSDLAVYLSIDWGGSNPFSVGVWQSFDGLGWVRIDEVYLANTTNSRLITECRKRPWWVNVRGAVADPSRNDLIRDWRDAGIAITAADNDVDSGIEAVRAAMAPVIGEPKFRVSPSRCRAWLNEIVSYQEKNGKPVKKFDHAMDETRYFVKWMIATKHARSGKVYTAGIMAKQAKEAKAAAKAEAAAVPVLPPSAAPVPPPPTPPAPVVAEPEIQGVKNAQRKGRVFTSR